MFQILEHLLFFAVKKYVAYLDLQILSFNL